MNAFGCGPVRDDGQTHALRYPAGILIATIALFLLAAISSHGRNANPQFPRDDSERSFLLPRREGRLRRLPITSIKGLECDIRRIEAIDAARVNIDFVGIRSRNIKGATPHRGQK